MSSLLEIVVSPCRAVRCDGGLSWAAPPASRRIIYHRRWAHSGECGRALKGRQSRRGGFGTVFLANPDLPERFRRNAPLNEPDRSTFYAPGAKGYIGYPTLAAQAHRSPPAGAPRVAARL